MKEGGEFSLKIEEGKNVLFYVIDGEVLVNGKLVIGHQLAVFGTKNTDIDLKAQSASRIIFGAGDPINEPMVSQGPFVMNTTTELMQAMRDYQMGKMGVM
jgi:redox-sensitive bicupin YhaK (pirin superfamily)